MAGTCQEDNVFDLIILPNWQSAWELKDFFTRDFVSWNIGLEKQKIDNIFLQSKEYQTGPWSDLKNCTRVSSENASSIECEIEDNFHWFMYALKLVERTNDRWDF